MQRGLRFTLILAILLSACATKYGAKSIKRVDWIEGFAYEATGRLEPWEEGERKAAEAMQQACPDGNPQFEFGHVLTEQMRGSTWSVIFTCDHPIEEF